MRSKWLRFGLTSSQDVEKKNLFLRFWKNSPNGTFLKFSVVFKFNEIWLLIHTLISVKGNANHINIVVVIVLFVVVA